MQNNKTLKDKYAHLEFSIVNFKEISQHLIFGSDFNSNKRINTLSALNSKSNKTLIEFFDLINTSISSIAEPAYIYDLTHSLGNFLTDVEIANENLGSNKKEAIAGDFIISRLRSYLQEMAVVGQKDFRQLFSSEYLIYRPKTNILSSNTLMAFVLTKTVQIILNHSQYGTEHPRFYEFVLNEMPIPQILIELNAEIDLIMEKAYHKLEQSKSLYKEAEGLLYESLGSTNSACSEVNSSLGNHCIDLVFSHEARTQSPLTLCKNAKNSTSKTADTRILRETQSDSAKDSDENNPVFANAKQSIESAESTKDFNIMDCHANPCGLSRNDERKADSHKALNSRNDASLSSLRGQRPKQSINKNNSCEAQPPLAPLRGSEIEEQGGSSASALLELEADKARLSPKSVPKACKRSEAKTSAAVFRSAFASHQPLARCVGERGGGAALFAKKSDYINENISAESRRSERVESFTKNAESQGDSSHSMQSTLQNFKAKFPYLNISVKPLSKSLQKSGRLDSEYYQAKYENIEALIKSYKGGFCRLKDLIKSYSTGFAFSSDDYLESGNLALIRINNIKNENLDMSNAIYLRDNAKDLSPKDKVKQGDILISMSGSIGLSCVIRENIEAMVNQRIFKISIENFSCDVLVLLLNSIFCKMQFDRIGTGGVQTNISNKDIENILIPLVDSQTQEQIASRLKLSFALKKEAKELLDLAKSKVECAIEGKIS